MSDARPLQSDDARRDDRLEAYLDGLLDDAQAAAFARSLKEDPALARQAALQARIDGALGRLFSVESPSHDAVAAALASAVGKLEALPSDAEIRPQMVKTAAAPAMRTTRRADVRVGASTKRLYWAAAVLAAAAAIGGILAAFPWNGAQRNMPLFAARPLAEIYRDAVTHGFEPTYECKDAERFAATFSERQGRPLQLLAMPSGTRMLGLAYVGGLSRQTTAMLCRVEGKPVMVFVDRAAADQQIAPDNSDAQLHVFREARDGLVYYEVTPFDAPRVLGLLAPAGEANSAS
jgi:anti-sigma factor RsiW